jgi:hypothetical protein
MDNLEPETIAEKTHKVAMSKRRLLPPIISKEIPLLPAIGSKDSFQIFNEIVGLPKHPATLEPSPMLPYQIEYNRLWNTYHKLMFNKSRKIGATETAFRTILQNCYGAYMGHNVMIIAGNRQRQANKILQEFKNLLYGPNGNGWTDLNKKVWDFDMLVESHSASLIRLKSGVEIETYPGDATAVRGPANIRCVFITEAAHFDLVDDSEVYNALRPLAANDPNVDFILETTPNGKRGFFYDQWVMEGNFYKKLEINYEAALEAGLLTREFIEQEKVNPRVDFNQEYFCKFTSTRNAAIIQDNIVYIPQKTYDFSDILGH